MSPTRYQYFVAENGPARVWGLTCSLAGLVVAIALCQPRWASLADPSTLAWLAGAAALGCAIGGYGGLLVGWPILGPLYYDQCLRNGAPYRTGDRVQILSRPHRGRVVTIYEIWDERNQVRVDLGPEAKKRVTDVFAYVEVCRVGEEILA